MSDSEFFDDVGYEPILDPTEDQSDTVFNLLEDAGVAEHAVVVNGIDEVIETITEVKESGQVNQETVETLESFGFDITGKKYTKGMFTQELSEVGADHVIAALENANEHLVKRAFKASGKAFVKAVAGGYKRASHAVKLMLDNTGGQKPAIDFSVERLNTLHDELKKAVEERGGWPTMGHEMLEDPTRPLDTYFLRDNIDKGLGAFVKRRAAAALVASMNGKRPVVEIQVLTRPAEVQSSISEASRALDNAVKTINATADIKTLLKDPSKIRPLRDDVAKAINDIKPRMTDQEPGEMGSPEDHQNFARIADSIDSAMKAIAKSDLDGAQFREMIARLTSLEKELEKAKTEEPVSEETLKAWGVLAKNISQASELYNCLSQFAVHVEHVADLFHRVLINARRDMVLALEISAERAEPMDAKRLMLIADKEKDRLVKDQDDMRAARKKAEAKRNLDG